MPAAVMLAGDRIASKPILDENKAFLVFRGEPLFIHVVKALIGSASIDRVVVVGPAERLRAALQEARLPADDGRVLIAEQGQNLVENAIVGFLGAVGVTADRDRLDDQFDELTHSEHRETAALFLSCDIPLVTPFEIDEFIEASDMEHYDYSVGLSDEATLTPYYPSDEAPGIRMSYYHLAEARCRHNNLHFGKPLKVTATHNIERMYELRYQKKFVNFFRSIAYIFRTGINTTAVLRHFLSLQLARSLGERGGGKLYEWFRRRNHLDHALELIGAALGARVQAVFTRYGGAVLDIDNAADLEAAEVMYDRWMSVQERIRDGR